MEAASEGKLSEGKLSEGKLSEGELSAEEPSGEESSEEELSAAEPSGEDLSEAEPSGEEPSEEELSDEGAGGGGPIPGVFEAGNLIFYPQIGHCHVGDVIQDAHSGLELLVLTPQDSSSGNRILVPVGQLGSRSIRHSGDSPGVIEGILGSDFDPTIDDATERLDRITDQEREGTASSLATALKRLHLRHELKTISREEEKRRSRIRKWLVVEYMVEKQGTSGQAQSAITRLLSRTMNAVREREKEAARELRKQERAERKAAEAERRARRRGRG